jgi:hypothetical protein
MGRCFGGQANQEVEGICSGLDVLCSPRLMCYRLGSQGGDIEAVGPLRGVA